MDKITKLENKPLVNKPFVASSYVLDEELKNAVELALQLNQPLLLTGEPGTGKTRLAAYAAHLLSESSNFSDEVLVFNTKTSSRASDLFYSYDALGHFQASNIKDLSADEQKSTGDFIELQALGKAIAYTNPDQLDKISNKIKLEKPSTKKSYVVLVDEIDKAPRDFTNDILHEIEKLQFQIKELDNLTLSTSEQSDARILIIMTSNSEKNLPDAFLRRCLFYHIEFPGKDKLKEILQAQVGDFLKSKDETLDLIIESFKKLRKYTPRKKPATAELVAWARMLDSIKFDSKSEADVEKKMIQYISVLVKTKEDREEALSKLESNTKNLVMEETI
jgi:MoxR-like ATPase